MMRAEEVVHRAPVGVRLAGTPGEAGTPGAAVYRGVSYCDAVRRAGEGEALLVLPGSIAVCGWAPVILGLHAPRTRFERRLKPRLPFPGGGLLLAPLSWFAGRAVEPDLVLVRARPDALARMIALAGPGALWAGHGRHLDRSAVFVFEAGPALRHPWRVTAVNRLLAFLARHRAWQVLTRWLFRSSAVTTGYDALIAATLADMSVCRNSTVVPLLTGQANVSYFCSGGITWGGNDPSHVTSGWPYALYRRVAAALPDEGAGDARRHPEGGSHA